MRIRRQGRVRAAGTALLVSTLLVSSAAWSIVQAKASRSLVIRLRGPADHLLFNVRSAALAAGLTCDNHDPEPSPKTPLRCWLAGQEGGILWATNVVEKNAFFIQIYSDNVFTPQGEIDPQMEAVLKTLWVALVGDLNISSIQECRAPESDRCAF